MLLTYDQKDRATRMLELRHRNEAGDRWLPMQYPPGAFTPDQILAAARAYILEPAIVEIRVLDLTSRENTWRVVRTITKTITEKEHVTR